MGGIVIGMGADNKRTIYPSDAEPDAAVRNSSFDPYPLTFEKGGTLLFPGEVVSGETTTIRFRFENSQSSDLASSYTTDAPMSLVTLFGRHTCIR